jgi:hypothetical protein
LTDHSQFPVGYKNDVQFKEFSTKTMPFPTATESKSARSGYIKKKKKSSTVHIPRQPV